MPTVNPQHIPDPPTNQFGWGTPFDSENCWAAEACDGLFFVTEGKLKVTPPQFRIKSGNTTRGPGYVQDIWNGARAYGIHEGTDHPELPTFKGYVALPWETAIKKLGNPKIMLEIATDYDQVPPNLSQQANFKQGHSVAAFGGTLSTPDAHGVRTVLVHDPIGGKAIRWPLWVLEAAAKKISRQQGMPKGTIFATQFRQATAPVVIPPVEDPGDLQEKINQLTAQLLEANTALATAQDDLLEAQGELLAIDLVQHPAPAAGGDMTEPHP